MDPQTLIWKTNDAFAAPLNLTAVLDLAPARGIHGKGLYVLYHDSLGKSRLYAQFFDRNYIPGEPDRVFTTAVQCPEGMYVGLFVFPRWTDRNPQMRLQLVHSLMRTAIHLYSLRLPRDCICSRR